MGTTSAFSSDRFNIPSQIADDLRDDELLTEADVARLLKISTLTLRFWRCYPPRHPVPPVVRIGRSVRYRTGDVRRFMATLNTA
jgi:hypothetical protein